MNAPDRPDRMISVVARHGGQICCRATCMDARGSTDAMLTDGTQRSTLDELAD